VDDGSYPHELSKLPVPPIAHSRIYSNAMAIRALDNPVWSSLTTLHRPLAIEAGRLVRYPAEVAPFVAIAEPAPVRGDDLAALIASGETAFVVGPAPEVPAGWELVSLGEILQMICTAPIEVTGREPVVALGEADRGAVLELTALVYPHYFRPRTTDLGRYLGIRGPGRLAAIIGERMGFPGHREISAVCTHPDDVGRGLARQLLGALGNDLLAHGVTPFLHVSPANTRAVELYARNHYAPRRTLGFWSLRRRDSTQPAQ
jgi:ribosomal protein S18 acetylase RimI-like enzyme